MTTERLVIHQTDKVSAQSPKKTEKQSDLVTATAGLPHGGGDSNAVSQQNTAENPDIINPDLPKYFVLKNGEVEQDKFGNYIMELTLVSDVSKKVHVVTESPVFFPEKENYREGLVGCDLGDFYIDFQATVSVVHQNDQEAAVHHYICDFSQRRSYFLRESREVSAVLVSSTEDIIKKRR